MIYVITILFIINGMKKYSSYAELKIASSPRSYPYPQYYPAKITSTPSARRPLQIPGMLIQKQSFAIPMTAKYSAGYLQKKKIFSSKKENKDVLNIKIPNNNANITMGNEKSSFGGKVVEYHRETNSKPKKHIEERQRIMKKDKALRIDKPVQIQNKQNQMGGKPYRFQVQSPKGTITRAKEEKSKSKLKEKQKQKSQKLQLFLNNKQKQKEKKQKQESGLNQYVTKYDPEPKNMLLHCTSQSHLIKTINLQEKTDIRGYYKSVVYNAFFSTKSSSFNQICKNHLITSIEFLTYAKKNHKQMVPTSFNKANLPNINRKTIIFDLDETLIHCNQSLDIPHDIALEITFPNNSKIKAGINVRPYAAECLRELSKYYEIIIFTASHECYANVIIDYLDPKKEYVSHRFFRQTCHKTEEGFYVKDLRVFGRDLSNLLLVDNAAYSYCFQPENGVPIVPFYNNKADMELKEVTTYLKDLAQTKNLRNKNESYMRLSQYHRFTCPKQLINQLYF